MSYYRITEIKNDQAKVRSSEQGSESKYGLNCFLDQNGEMAWNLNQGDLVTLERGYFILVKYSGNNVYSSSEFFNLNPSHWLVALFPYCRPADPLIDFNLLFGLRILEYSFSYKTKTMIDKLMEVCNEYRDYLESMVGRYFNSFVIDIAKDVLVNQKYLTGLIQMFFNRCSQPYEALDIKLTIYSYYSFERQISNKNGSIEFNFLAMDRSYHLIYSKADNEVLSNKNIGQNMRHYQKTLIENLDTQELENKLMKVNRNLTDLKELINIVLKDLIKKGQSNLVIQYYSLLSAHGLYTTDIYETINNSCINCFQFGSKVILLECNHKACETCYVNTISEFTNGVFVFNEQESQMPSYCKCGFQISEHHMAINLPNYEVYKKNALVRARFRCLGCSFTGDFNDFLVSCRHTCVQCTVDKNIRKNIRKCEFCNYIITNQEFKQYMDLSLECESCLKSFLWVKDFDRKLCKHNLCLICLTEAKSQICCYDCPSFNLSISEFDMLFKIKCLSCSIVFEKKSKYWKMKCCQCQCCDYCMFSEEKFIENKRQCPYCEMVWSDEAAEYFNKQFKEFSVMTQTKRQCEICYSEHPITKIIDMMDCGKNVCRPCLRNYTESNLGDITLIDNVKKCPLSGHEINNGQFTTFLTPPEMEKYNYFILNKEGDLIDCPRCKEKFTTNMSRKLICVGKECNYTFCKQCKEPYHENGDCEEVYIQERIKILEKDPGGVTQCPRCRLPYIKNLESCQHATCINPCCGIDFCFQCACIRSPTLAHGNHYHRPKCQYFSNYDGRDDIMKDSCSECVKLGKLCKKPKDLRIPRLVDKDEVE